MADGSEMLSPEAHVVHTCRDFDAIIGWARERKIDKPTREQKVGG
jgi:hypothetical protein